MGKTVFGIPVINPDLTFGLPILIILGLILSTWAVDFSILSLHFLRIFEIEGFYGAFYKTHILIYIATSIFLYFGIKNANVVLINYWTALKVIEAVIVLIGIPSFVFSGRIHLTWVYVTVALCIVIVDYYIYKCVDVARKEIQLPNAKEESPPPPYDTLDTINQLNQAAQDVLRAFAKGKLLEYILIVPALFIIILYSTDQLNLLMIVFICLGLCTLIYLTVGYMFSTSGKKPDNNSESQS